jgi:hypothetical protein
METRLTLSGVLEVTRIRQEGFAWRPEFADFARRYKIVAFPWLGLDNVPLTSESCVKIINVRPFSIDLLIPSGSQAREVGSRKDKAFS